MGHGGRRAAAVRVVSWSGCNPAPLLRTQPSEGLLQRGSCAHPGQDKTRVCRAWDEGRCAWQPSVDSTCVHIGSCSQAMAMSMNDELDQQSKVVDKIGDRMGGTII